MLEGLKTVSEFINKVCEFLVVVTISTLVIVLAAQIIFRYLFSHSLTWADGMGRYMLVWSSFLGASIAAKHSGHINLTIITDMLEGKKKEILITFILICFLVMAAAVFVSGVTVTKMVIPQKSDSLPISAAWVYGAIPFSLGIIVFHLFVNTLIKIKNIFEG